MTTPSGTTNGVAFTVIPALATVPGPSLAEVRGYPNPVRADFTVVPAIAGAGRVQAELRNSLGQLVRQQSAALPAAGAQLTVPAAGLAAGVYVLRLQAGSTILIQRLVVQ